MRKIRGKFLYFITRHPLLYYIRYILLSKNKKGQCAEAIGCFNDINFIETVPELYFEVSSQIVLLPEWDQFEKAMEIGRYLREHISGGKGIGLSSTVTLQKMIDGKGGVCSDFSQIFCLFCLINNIKVREWGSVDFLYKPNFGHSFNEIYSDYLQKWIAIDIHKAIIFRDSKQQLLSTIEMFTQLRLDKSIDYHFYSLYEPPKKERIPLIYSKVTIPFLIANYKTTVNDYFFSKFKKYPPALVGMIIILMRKNYNFVFAIDNYRVKLLPKRLQKLQIFSGL